MRTLLVISSILLPAALASPVFERAEQVATSVFSLAFDKSYEEAPHTETVVQDNVVERQYPEKSWACTSVTVDEESERSQGTMFWRLFGYIQGANDQQKKMDMTVPVSTLVSETSGNKKLEMCFYIGEEHQANTPAPSNSEVYIKKFAAKLYTRTLPGYMNTLLWKQEANALKEVLKQLGVSFQEDRYYKVGYDAPFKFWNRRNEIWYLAQ